LENWKKLEVKQNSKKFKILQLSNAIWTPSGYGVQSKGSLHEWNKYYDVRQLAMYGLEGAKNEFNGLQIYPILPGDQHGDRTARLIFKNSPWKPDLFVTLYDIWMGAYIDEDPTSPRGFKAIHPYWIPIVMVDHDPVPEATVLSASAAYRVVTPTRFGEKELKRNGLSVWRIPFGVDTQTYKPISPEEKGKLKTWLSNVTAPFDLQNQSPITEDSFLIMMNGANKDPYRKGFMRMFTAIQVFLQQNPDAEKDLRVYVHSWMRQARDIPHGAKVLRIQHLCRGTDDYHNLCGIPARIMAKRYGAADVFMHLSEGGGFEIPILEALACALPVIGSNFVGMNELVKDHGWSIPMLTRYFTALDGTAGIADEWKAAEALEDAYNHPDKREKYGKGGHEFALDFDFKLVNEQWIKFFEDVRDETGYKPLEARRL
jgi:glycosyltransferase involved in cell wall biosynthesis